MGDKGVIGPDAGLHRQVRARIAEIRERLDELRTRSEELTRPDERTGYSERSLELADEARIHAGDAGRRTIAAYANAADAHDRVAAMYEYLLQAGIGDLARHREKAREHRDLAAADRLRAAARHSD